MIDVPQDAGIVASGNRSHHPLLSSRICAAFERCGAETMSPLDETARYLEQRLGWPELDALLLAIAIHAVGSISDQRRADAAAILNEAALTRRVWRHDEADRESFPEDVP
jgi:hypothetical protein